MSDETKKTDDARMDQQAKRPALPWETGSCPANCPGPVAYKAVLNIAVLWIHLVELAGKKPDGPRRLLGSVTDQIAGALRDAGVDIQRMPDPSSPEVH